MNSVLNTLNRQQSHFFRCRFRNTSHTMHYIWILIIVTLCAAAQRCTDSSNMNTHNRTPYRVSDEDFDILFTNAVVTTSRFHCITLCSTNRTNTYYESSTRRCSCQGLCFSCSPVSTGTNYVEQYFLPVQGE